MAIRHVIRPLMSESLHQLVDQGRERQGAAAARQRGSAGFNKQIIEARVPGGGHTVRNTARDPYRAARRHNPQVIFRPTTHCTIQHNNQLPFAMGMHRHFRFILDKIKMTGDGRAGRGVRIVQRIGKR